LKKKSNYEIITGFLQKYKHNGSQIILSECEVINDYDKFVESHISALKANSGNKTFSPYYSRLVKLYKIINK